MMAASFKILVCGDVNGQFKTLYTKVEDVSRRKGPFECLFCVGNFFGSNNDEWNDVVSGKISVPLTTYMLGPNKREHLKFYPDNSAELVSNIVYLGKRGHLTLTSGLKIAYLSGTEQQETTPVSFSKKDISELVSSITNSIDILLTSQWPQGVTKYAKLPENVGALDVGSSFVSYLAKQLKPRYHFSGLSGVHYERLPYRNHQVLQEMTKNTTRFIGLATIDNVKHSKWMYAFNLTPISSATLKELTEVSSTVTESPYNLEEYQDQFFFDMCSTSRSEKRSWNEDGKSNAKRKQISPVTQDKCWFCLTNPDFEKQLLLSIGEHSYITLAKGGIVQDHLLIIPLEHIQATTNLSEMAEREVDEYKDSLVKYFHDRGKDVIFFERNFASPHLQIQIVPIPNTATFQIKEAILEFAASKGLEFTELSKYSLLNQVVPSKKAYFYVEIVVNKKSAGRLLHMIDKNFPMQFGRMMVASRPILNVPERVDWKECKMPPDEELKVAEGFRQSFKPYDFTKM